MVIMSLACVSIASAQQSSTEFDIIVSEMGNDDDDKLYQDPHRGSTNEDVYGTFDAFTGSLCLGASFDIACVQIYKDGQLIVNESYPVMTGGEVYYNLSFYGSGVYNICIYDAEGNSYFGWITGC